MRGEPLPSVAPLTEEHLFAVEVHLDGKGEEVAVFVHDGTVADTARKFIGHPLMIRKLIYPNVRFLRAFEHVAYECFVLHRQECGLDYPNKPENWVQ